ncbi:MAG: TolC family protein [Flavobacteriales bacterium]
MNLKMCLLAGSFFLSLWAGGQELYQLTLQQAIDLAMKNNSSVLISQNDLRSAKMKVRETAAIGLPQINGSISYQDFIKQPVSLIPAEFFGGPKGTFSEITFGTKQNASAELQASQLIFDGSYIVGLQTTQTFLELSKLKLQKTRLEVKEQVSRSYAAALVAGKNRQILQKNVEFIEKNLQETRQLYAGGMLEEQDVEQLQLLVSDMHNRLASAERQLRISHNMLKMQLGIAFTDSVRLTDNFEALIDTVLNSDLVSTAFSAEKNPDFRLAATQEQLALLNLRNEKMKYYPSVNAFLSHSENAYREEFDFLQNDKDWFPTTVWGMNVSIPIFSSFMRHYKVQQAKVQLENSALIKKQARQNLSIAAMNARSALKEAITGYKISKDNLGLAVSIRDKTAIKYKEGMVSSLQLTQAETQLLSMQTAYILSMFNLMNAKVELEKIINDN